MNILITGASGYIGRMVGEHLAQDHQVIGISRSGKAGAGVDSRVMDIRDPALGDLLNTEQISHVVHLAAVLEDTDRELAFDIDVNGTRNVLDACVAAGVRHITISSSAAAYGYHADNPERISEDDALRGNPEFPYSDHKRQIEAMLARYRENHPELRQLVLRVCAVLGADTRNLITNLFERPKVLVIQGSASPFTLIWDEDLARVIEKGVTEDREGIYNIAGDGALTTPEMAEIMQKPTVKLPVWLLKSALAIGKALRLTRYGPAQINFLRYRPVLDNARLKNDFGYIPEKSSREVFDLWWHHTGSRL